MKAFSKIILSLILILGLMATIIACGIDNSEDDFDNGAIESATESEKQDEDDGQDKKDESDSDSESDSAVETESNSTHINIAEDDDKSYGPIM